MSALGARPGGLDALLAQPLHRGLGALLDLLRGLGPAEPGDARELLLGRLGELLERAEAQAVHAPRDGLGHPFDLLERGDGLLLHLLELALADDVELPAGELRGEAHVLSLAADGERQLLVGDDELHPAVGLVDDDLVHLGGLDSRADEARRVAVVGDDVDLLAAQLLHDGLHARALHPDARAHRVDVGVAAGHRDLRARAGLAGAGDDAHDALVDLRDLGLEELLDELAGLRATG